MDNNAGSANGQEAPAPKLYTQPSEAVEQKKKPNKGLMIGIAAGVVFVAAIVLVLILFVFAPVSGSTADAREDRPVVYMEDDEVYLAVGTQTVELKDAAVIEEGSSVNSTISYDGRYFFYLAEVDEQTGEGKLVMIDLVSDLEAKVIEEDVCAASVSSGGAYMLFFKDVEDGKGTLYHARIGKEATEVAKDVVADNYIISTDGMSYSYFEQPNDDTLQMYACIRGAEPQKIEEVSLDEGEDLSGWFITDGGAVLYEYRETDEDSGEVEKKLYIYKDGEEERIAKDARIEMVFDPELKQMLYSDEDTLYYKEMGEDKERISKDYYFAMFKPYFGSDMYNVYDTHFLLAENDDEDDAYPDEVMLYEVRIGSDPVKITKADTWSYDISPDFKWVSFERDDDLCLCYKDRDEWSDRIEICELSLQNSFDEKGEYLYYIELNDEEDEYGDLYRYQLTQKEHEPELLQYDVREFYFNNGVLITLTSDDEIYKINSKEDKKLLFDEEIYDWDYAPNGIYVYTEAKNYDIYYIAWDGQAETICYDASDILYTNFSITHNFTMPVPKDLVEDLSQAYEDARYLHDIINETDYSDNEGYFMNFEAHIEILEEMLGRDDLSDEAIEMIESFYQGFLQVEIFAYSTVDSDEEQQAKDSIDLYFEQAYDLFESIIGQSTADLSQLQIANEPAED